MALNQAAVGMRVTWSIGTRGGPIDRYPARIKSRPVLGTLNGQLVNTVEIIALRKNLAGQEYTSERLVNARFLDPRSDMVEALDGTAAKPKPITDLVAEHNDAVRAFQATRAAAMSVDSLTAAELSVE